MNRLVRCVALLLAVTGNVLASDAATEQLVEQAVEAYGAAQSLTDRDARIAAFSRAEQLFAQASRQGAASADLYANIGTAALQAERLGAAVLAFRRALVVDPDHTRARRNLAHARALLPAWVPKPGEDGVLDTFFFWHRALSAGERGGAGALCFVLAMFAFAGSIRWRNRFARGLGLVLAAAWLALVASVLVDTQRGRLSHAVLTADDTLARASDSPNAPARFAESLPAGTEIREIERRQRWSRIRLANDREAWVPRQSFEVLAQSGPHTDITD